MITVDHGSTSTILVKFKNKKKQQKTKSNNADQVYVLISTMYKYQ